MFPVLFTIGSFSLKTSAVMFLLAIFISSFIFWRKGKEEYYDTLELFDGFVLSTFFGVLAARIAFVLLNINLFGLDLLKWFDVINHRGFNLIVGIAVASFYLHQFAVEKKWDAFEVLDFWVTSIALGLSINFVGLFFEGVGYGNSTQMPWGVVFPQLIDPHHPIQLYTAIFYAYMYVYLFRVEYKYRTFSWYRYGKKTAQTGFLVSMFLIYVALFSFFMTFLRPAALEIYGLNIDSVISICLLICGICLLYYRSGRQIPLPFHRRPKAVRTKLEDLGE